MRQPLAQISFVDFGSLGELCARHGPLGVERLVEAQRVADPHHGDAGRAPEVSQHLANELIELVLVHAVPPSPSESVQRTASSSSETSTATFVVSSSVRRI